MAVSYPGSIKTFSTKAPGQAIASSHINELQDEVVAIETQLGTNAGEWVTYTPTFTAATGTFANTTGSIGYYCTIGKVMHISIYFKIVDKGTASGVWNFSLPSGFTCSVSSAGYGREILLMGKMQQLIVMSSDNTVTVRNYDNSSSIATGHAFICNITLGV